MNMSMLSMRNLKGPALCEFKSLYDDSDNQESTTVEVESLPKPASIHPEFAALYSWAIFLGRSQSV